MEKEWSWPEQYNPFKYPPDYQLAKIHQNSTQPGYPDLFKPHCTCCKMPGKSAYNGWFNRFIQRDFRFNGGGVITHFWLARLFLLTIILAFIVFGAYVQYLSWYYCTEDDPCLRIEACRSLFKIWIISNQDLYEVMIKEQDWVAVHRFSILRTILFVILITANTCALYLVRSYNYQYPDQPNLADFSLLFKNTSQTIQQLISILKSQFGDFKYHQAFIIKQTEPFSTLYKKKIQIYFECKWQQDPKRIAEMIKEIKKLQKQCEQSQSLFGVNSRRAIIVFDDYTVKTKILLKYKVGWCQQFCTVFGTSQCNGSNFICEQCPRLQQLIWGNIGVEQGRASRGKLLSICLFMLLLIVAVGILYIISFLVYLRDDQMYWNVIIQNIVLFFVALLTVYFRNIMYVLVQYRFPETYSKRAVFIIITSTLLHFIFYVWLPSLYVRLFSDIRGETLRLMSNQAITGIIMQIILVSIDLDHHLWESKLEKIKSEEKPFACQKILHQHIQYPRYPIEQRSIVLFKFWSLITFFAFHVPLVVGVLLIGLLFLYYKDKFNIYRHYRMEMIRNNIQFYYLKIYTNIFTISIFLIFAYTQRQMVEKVTSAIITVIALYFQIWHFRNMVKTNLQNDQQGGKKLFDSISSQVNTFYKEAYDSFCNSIKNQDLDIKIKKFVSYLSFGTNQS